MRKAAILSAIIFVVAAFSAAGAFSSSGNGHTTFFLNQGASVLHDQAGAFEGADENSDKKPSDVVILQPRDRYYHRWDCEKLKSDNTREALRGHAEQMGFKACPVCNP